MAEEDLPWQKAKACVLRQLGCEQRSFLLAVPFAVAAVWLPQKVPSFGRGSVVASGGLLDAFATCVR